MIEAESENYPQKKRTLTIEGDVTEIRFLLKDHLVVSSSSGSVKLLQNTASDFKEITSWKNLHYFSTEEQSSCTAVACFEEDVATVGEDCRIALLTVTQTKPVRVIGKYSFKVPFYFYTVL